MNVESNESLAKQLCNLRGMELENFNVGSRKVGPSDYTKEERNESKESLVVKCETQDVKLLSNIQNCWEKTKLLGKKSNKIVTTSKEINKKMKKSITHVKLKNRILLRNAKEKVLKIYKKCRYKKPNPPTKKRDTAKNKAGKKVKKQRAEKFNNGVKARIKKQCNLIKRFITKKNNIAAKKYNKKVRKVSQIMFIAYYALHYLPFATAIKLAIQLATKSDKIANFKPFVQLIVGIIGVVLISYLKKNTKIMSMFSAFFFIFADIFLVIYGVTTFLNFKNTEIFDILVAKAQRFFTLFSNLVSNHINEFKSQKIKAYPFYQI